MNPRKTSEHKDANENQWEEKATPHEMQIEISEKKKQHHEKRTLQRVNAMEEMKSMKARETTSSTKMAKGSRKTRTTLESENEEGKA